MNSIQIDPQTGERIDSGQIKIDPQTGERIGIQNSTAHLFGSDPQNLGNIAQQGLQNAAAGAVEGLANVPDS